MTNALRYTTNRTDAGITLQTYTGGSVQDWQGVAGAQSELATSAGRLYILYDVLYNNGE